MPASVRTHTRRTTGGRTVTVNRHTRATRGRRPRPAARRGVLRPGRAIKNLRRAYRAARRDKTARALMFGALGLGELGAWLTLRGAAAVGVMAALAVLGVVLALSTAGSPPPPRGGDRR